MFGGINTVCGPATTLIFGIFILSEGYLWPWGGENEIMNGLAFDGPVGGRSWKGGGGELRFEAGEMRRHAFN